MKRGWRVGGASAAGILALLLGAALPAQEVGETLTGEIADVDLHGSPRTVTVELDGGGRVEARIANRTRIVFPPGLEREFPSPGVGDLKPGMKVRFRWAGDDVTDRLHVTDAPMYGGGRVEPNRPRPTPTPTPRVERRELKVRVLDVDARRSEIRADVAGRAQTFRVAERSLLGRVDRGDLLVVVVESRGGEQVIVDLELAVQTGRITALDRRGDRIEIDRVWYGLLSPRLLGGLRVGDRVRFEYEDRGGGRKVITRLD